MTDRPLIIIGGGVAGLSCGIYALRSGFNVTLVVSKMLGLRNTASMTAVVDSSPAHVGASWLGNSFADADGHIWRELSLSRLIATPDFLMVGR